MSVQRKLISSGSPFEASIGYSRAVVQSTPAGDWCFVSGTTGYDYAAMVMPDDPAAQTRQAIATIEKTLAEAGFQLSDVLRVRYYLVHADLAEEVIPVLGEAFGAIRPAATLVVADLLKPEMMIEIEVDAYRAP